MVGARSSASWGSMYVSQQNGSLDSGWADILWEELSSDRKAAWHNGRLFSLPSNSDLPDNYEGLLEAVVTFDGRLPRLDQIQMLESTTDSQVTAQACAEEHSFQPSIIFDWRFMNLGVCTIRDVDNQIIVMEWGSP